MSLTPSSSGPPQKSPFASSSSSSSSSRSYTNRRAASASGQPSPFSSSSSSSSNSSSSRTVTYTQKNILPQPQISPFASVTKPAAKNNNRPQSSTHSINAAVAKRSTTVQVNGTTTIPTPSPALAAAPATSTTPRSASTSTSTSTPTMENRSSIFMKRKRSASSKTFTVNTKVQPAPSAQHHKKGSESARIMSFKTRHPSLQTNIASKSSNTSSSTTTSTSNNNGNGNGNSSSTRTFTTTNTPSPRKMNFHYVAVAPDPLEVESRKFSQMSRESMTEEVTCSICMDIIVKATVTNPCGHLFCASCLTNVMNTPTAAKSVPTNPRKRSASPTIECPVCRTNITSTTQCPPMDNIILGMAMRGDFPQDDFDHFIKRANIKLPSQKVCMYGCLLCFCYCQDLSVNLFLYLCPCVFHFTVS